MNLHCSEKQILPGSGYPRCCSAAGPHPSRSSSRPSQMGVVRLRTKLRLVNACLTPRIAGSHGLPAHSVRVFYAAAQGGAGAGPGIVPASGKAAATGWHWPLCGSEPCSRTVASEASEVSGEGGGAALPANVAQKVKRTQRPRGGGSAKRHKRPAPSEPGDRGSWRNEGTQDGCGSAAERSPASPGALTELPTEKEVRGQGPLPQAGPAPTVFPAAHFFPAREFRHPRPRT
jgi:hypothetical protein